MKIDFHTHANLSKKIPVSIEEFKKKMDSAHKNGLDAVAITEHFNAKNFLSFYEEMEQVYSYQGNHYRLGELKVFPGIEIDVKETGHFLVVADRDVIKAIRKRLIGHEAEGDFISVKDLLAFLADYNVLKIAAHPYRDSTPWIHHEENILHQFDAFDINGKDLFKYGLSMKQRVETLGKQYNIPVVGGSDTHQSLQYGAIYNRFPDCDTVSELKEALIKQNYKIEVSPCLDTKVHSAKVVKGMIKKQISRTV
ncbi:PHP domain-containing protein [Thalassobacillus sp. CUG 92003]|uniref:PHP domain-containing protein n=1 Tax=Thalassobacillus sp. CUG 92003 TaxID=2736641 RepID=UPI0015E7BCE1|nr:PHP domain-containing protein [Thalassobacillus sp. CUG 92003]